MWTEKITKTNWNSKECWAPRNPILGHNSDKKNHSRSFQNEVNSWTFHSFRHLGHWNGYFSLNSISTFLFSNDITTTLINVPPLSIQSVDIICVARVEMSTKCSYYLNTDGKIKCSHFPNDFQKRKNEVRHDDVCQSMFFVFVLIF